MGFNQVCVCRHTQPSRRTSMRGFFYACYEDVKGETLNEKHEV
jgi:hypothetical protein